MNIDNKKYFSKLNISGTPPLYLWTNISFEQNDSGVLWVNVVRVE